MDIEVVGAGFNSAGRTDGVARAPTALRRAGLMDAVRTSAGRKAPSGDDGESDRALGDGAADDHAASDGAASDGAASDHAADDGAVSDGAADDGAVSDGAAADGWRVRDLGDVAFDEPVAERGRRSGLLAEAALVSMIAAVRRRVAASLRRGRFPLLVGGDCPVLLGALEACRTVYGDAGLLFVDGHEDAWPPAESTTGEAADCELGLALGVVPADLPGGLETRLRTEAVALLGPRDAGEIAAHDVPSLRGTVAWFADDREVSGRAAAMATEAISAVRRSVHRWWLHVDLDVLATGELAAVDYPQPGGLDWADLTAITVEALGTPGCTGWSLAIYNPDLDPDARGAERIVRYVRAAMTAAATP